MSLAKYHINPATGKASRCFAKIQCRFGGPAVHFPSENDARDFYERAMERKTWEDKQLSPGEVNAIDAETFDIGERNFYLPTGKYFIGDPYLFIATQDQKGWNGIIDSIEDQFGWETNVGDAGKQEKIAVGAMYEDAPILALKAYHGEGLHWSVGPVRRIPSESGLVGFMDEKALTRFNYTASDVEAKKMGTFIELDEGMKVWRDKQGIIVFGGRGLITHNDLLADSFEAFSRVDGINDSYPTKETYDTLIARAHLWRDDPMGFYREVSKN